LLLVSSNLHCQTSGVLIDDFDGRDGLRHWTFSNGAEFPGASGQLLPGPGHKGRGAALVYRFTCLDRTHCGHYVAAIWKAPHPIDLQPGAALSLWVTISPEVRLTVRVRDQTGQIVQFHPNIPSLEHQSPGEWQPVIVPITGKAAESWGGSNTGKLRGPIAEIAILADSRLMKPVEGRMAFDDVMLIGAADTTCTLKAALGLTGGARTAAHLGINIHSLQDQQGLDVAQAAGFGFVRTDLLWAEVEKNGHYDFSAFDELMHSLDRRRMGVLWVVDYGHPMHGREYPKSEADFAAYGRYAAAAVAHFRGQNARFEIWNEPNLTRFLGNPQIYPKLLGAALDAIRRSDPEVLVSSGGTSGLDFPFLTSLLASGATQKASAIAVHPYRDAGPETATGDVLLLRDLIRRSSQNNLAIWNTEWGYSSGGTAVNGVRQDGHSEAARKRQAVLTVRECLTVFALGLPVGVVYDLRDDGSNPFDREQNFGLLNQDTSEKPAMTALRVLRSTTSGRTYSGLIRDVPYGVHAMRFDGANDMLFIVWTELSTWRTRIQTDGNALPTVSNMFGEMILPEGGEFTVGEEAGPVYVRWKR
jgi:hypothetical protein